MSETFEQRTDPRSWVVWEGGMCPVGPDVTVSFIRRSGELVKDVDRADDFNWGRYSTPQPTDIIAYSVNPSPALEKAE